MRRGRSSRGAFGAEPGLGPDPAPQLAVSSVAPEVTGRPTIGRGITVLLNRGAGAALGADADRHPLQAQVEEAFRAEGHAVSVLSARADALDALAERAAAAGAPVIVAGGGDGTISTVAASVAGTGTALGVLPLGTLNHFAKDMGIPLDLPAAIRAIVAGRTTLVDVGEVNGRVFINNASLGLYPSLVHQREKGQARGRGKWTATALAAARLWRRYRHVRVVVQAGSKTRVVRTPIVFIGNNQYHLEGTQFGGRVRLDAGTLHLATAPGMTRAQMLRAVVATLAGRSPLEEQLDSVLTPHLSITAWRRHLGVALDGEVMLMPTPLRFRSRPGALRVCVPEETAPVDA
jgi:diacylglycerol kinase family enzyme